MTAAAIALVVLVLAPWPLYRILTIPPFRKWYFCYAVRVLLILIVYGLALAVVAIYAPALLIVAAFAAVTVLAAERWRARTHYGQSRGLPPGRLTLVPRGPWVDDRFFARLATVHGPVFKTSQYFFPMVCIVGAKRGIALLSEHQERLLPPEIRFNRFIPKGLLRYMRDPHHAAYRRIFDSSINSVAINSSQKSVTDEIRRCFAQMGKASQSAPESGIRPAPYVHDMAFAIIMSVFFGVQRGTDAFVRLETLYQHLDIRKAACGSAKNETRAAEAITRIITEHAESLLERVDGESNTGSSILAEMLGRNAKALEDRTLAGNLVYLAKVGMTDMRGLLGWTLKLLIDNPQWMSRLRDEEPTDPYPGEDSAALARRIIKETLRLEQSEFLFRRANDNIEFGGFVIPKGWRIRICIREGHRSAEIFDEPDLFNPDRFLGKNYTQEEYCPLGALNRSCMGAQIIDLVGARFVSILASDFVATKTRDGSRQYGPAHWEPGPDFRVSLAPLQVERVLSKDAYNRSN